MKNNMENSDMNTVPIWHKQNLTFKEAAEYSNIGTTKLRSLAAEFNCPFALHIGKKILIKRREFEEYLSKASEL